jgi:hypothetical protein
MRIGRVHATRLTMTAGLCLVLSSCGSGASTGPPAVGLSITAPTSGAVVGVRTIEVAGSVAPAGSVVRVGGRRIGVRAGAFASSLRLRGRTTQIRITARAPGYQSASVETTIHYSASTADALVASRQATSASPQAESQPSLAAVLVGSARMQITPAITRQAVDACVAGGGSRVECGCEMSEYTKLGAFRTRASVLAFVTEFEQALQTHDYTRLPLATRQAALKCASEGLGLTTASG